jgi:transposase
VTVIAADLGVTPRTIRDWLHAAGLPLASTRSRHRRRSILDDPSWLRRQHIDEGLSAWAIGQELSVPTAEVRATLESFGIEDHPSIRMTADALRTAFADGATVTSIARTAGVDRATVRTALRRHGIENPLAERYRRPAELDDAEWVRARDTVDRMSIRAIADELGVANNTVGRALKLHDVPRRRQADRPGGIAQSGSASGTSTTG